MIINPIRLMMSFGITLREGGRWEYGERYRGTIRTFLVWRYTRSARARGTSNLTSTVRTALKHAGTTLPLL